MINTDYHYVCLQFQRVNMVGEKLIDGTYTTKNEYIQRLHSIVVQLVLIHCKRKQEETLTFHRIWLKREKIIQGGCLFFMQLMHSMWSPAKPDIEDNPMLLSCSKNKNWLAKYAATTSMYGRYGHSYTTTSVHELVWCDTRAKISRVKGLLNWSTY